MLNKISSGKIFFDDFTDTTLNPIWQASPTDPSRYSLTSRSGYLRLKHGGTPLYLLMDMPNRDFVFEIKNDYFPVIAKDTAGIILYRDAVHRVEFLEYYDPNKLGNYGYMRLIRKGNLYSAYGSINGTVWELIGTCTADNMNKIGLVINHEQQAGSVDFDVDWVKIFGDNRFVVGNLKPGMRVELVDSIGSVLASSTCAPNSDNTFIDLTNFSVPIIGKVRIYESDILIDESEEQEIWGGDVFWYGLLVEVYMDNQLLPKDRETSLGNMINGVIEKQIEVRNPGSIPLSNVRVKKSPYFNYKGADWVKIAEDIGGIPGVYSDEVLIGVLNPGESRKLWIRVTKQLTTDIALVGNLKFLLQVSN